MIAKLQLYLQRLVTTHVTFPIAREVARLEGVIMRSTRDIIGDLSRCDQHGTVYLIAPEGCYARRYTIRDNNSLALSIRPQLPLKPGAVLLSTRGSIIGVSVGTRVQTLTAAFEGDFCLIQDEVLQAQEVIVTITKSSTDL